MLCRLHNFKPILSIWSYVMLQKKDTAFSCSTLGISLLQFISPIARGRKRGCHCRWCQSELGRTSNSREGTAVLGPSEPLLVGSGWMEKRLEAATTTSSHLCQSSASLFASSCSYLYAAVHVKGLYTKVMTKEEGFMISMSLDTTRYWYNVYVLIQ